MESIVEKAMAGDKDAFGKLVEKYKAAVFASALHLVGNEEDAKDISQETFIKAYINLPNLRESGKFANWLMQIVRNTSMSWHRSRMKRQEVLYGGITEMEDMRVNHETGETIAEANEVRLMVLQLLSRLSEKNRLTVMLYYIDGLTYQEIADMQGVPISTVKGRLYQSKKLLKKGMTSMMEYTLKGMAPDSEFTESVVNIIRRMEEAAEKIQSIQFVLEEVNLDTQSVYMRTIEYQAPKKYRVESESTLYISDGSSAFFVNKKENIATISSPEQLLPNRIFRLILAVLVIRMTLHGDGMKDGLRWFLSEIFTLSFNFSMNFKAN